VRHAVGFLLLAGDPRRTAAIGRQFHTNGLGDGRFEQVIEISLVHDGLPFVAAAFNEGATEFGKATPADTQRLRKLNMIRP